MAGGGVLQLCVGFSTSGYSLCKLMALPIPGEHAPSKKQKFDFLTKNEASEIFYNKQRFSKHP
jgi:hypothetical protein